MLAAIASLILTVAEEAPPTFRLPADTRPLSYAIALELDPRKDDYAGKFVTYKSQRGVATLFAVVRDNRGGQAWSSIDVLVQ